MNDTQAKALAGLSSLADKVALELVFAQPGSDSGLLPINSFLSDMEEAAQRETVPAPAAAGIAKARALVESVFLSDGNFTRESLDQLSLWVPWFQSVTTALSDGKTPPPFPTQSKPAPEPSDHSEQSLQLNLAADRELLVEFVNESREHLQNIETGVLLLEENPTNADTLNSIFRAFHTFKGGSGFLHLLPMNKLAHELESLLDLARNQRIQITSEVAELILNGGDTLKKFIDAIDLQLNGQTPQSPILIPTQSLRQRIAKIIANVSEDTTFRRAHAGTETSTFQRVAQASASPTIKIDTAKLDTLIDMVGEMLVAQSLVAQDAAALSSSRMAGNLTHLARATKELQRTALSLRMVPIGPTFQKMNRLVRDLSLRAEKQIHLHVGGEESELDRNIIDAIADPLVHMIRNSVDHGIEQPAVRQAAGKNPIGEITLGAYHHGGSFIIQIKDDGAGLNRKRILQKAISIGLITSEANLSDKEIFNLIFAPGFSTAETITDLSGRGVGMDVVRLNIEKIRGKIDVESTEGKGATFTISLPLTLAIIDGLIVRVGNDRYIIPTLSIRESFRPSAEMLSTVHNKGEVVSVRGRVLPLLRLHHFLNGHADTTDPTQAVLVIVESEGAERCLLVDELIGRQEVVIKSLGEIFQTNPLLAGAAILGDGRVGLILDVNALVHPKLPTLSKAA